MVSRMRWSSFHPTLRKIQSHIINIRDFGSLIPLNIKEDTVNLMRGTKCNWLLKFYVWKRCMAYIFLMAHFITMR